jgi:hypothetical protein
MRNSNIIFAEMWLVILEREHSKKETNIIYLHWNRRAFETTLHYFVALSVDSKACDLRHKENYHLEFTIALRYKF